MGGFESSQISRESVTPTTGIDAKEGDGVEEKEAFVKKMEEREIPIPTQELPPPQPSLFMVEGMGGLESSQNFQGRGNEGNWIGGERGGGVGGKRSFCQIMGGERIPPGLENQANPLKSGKPPS